MDNTDDDSKNMNDLDQDIVPNDKVVKSSDADEILNHPSTVITSNHESNLYSQGLTGSSI